MNILYLTYDGLIDPLGQSQILPYLKGLAVKGHQITIISFEKPNPESRIQNPESKIGNNLLSYPLRYHKSPPILSTLYDIFLLQSMVKRVMKNQQIDIIHCRSYITSLVGLWAKKRYRIKFIFDMRGFWADERVEGGLWNRRKPVFNWIYSYFKKKEKEFINEADAVISLTHNAKREIESWNKNNLIGDKISVIPTCTDLDLFDPGKISIEKTTELKENLGIGKDDFVLLYLGSLGTWYMLDEMLDFFEKLKAERSKRKGQTKFLFVTREQKKVNEAINVRHLDENDFILTSCPRVDVRKHISLCNASIFFIIPTYSKKASSATKMGEIMAMGKPVITNTGWGDVEALIDRNCGILVDELSQQGYLKSIDELQNMNVDPVEIRHIAAQYFSLGKGIETYHSIYQQLAEN